jgi:tetratricopeptide (TPR) repeat protein
MKAIQKDRKISNSLWGAGLLLLLSSNALQAKINPSSVQYYVLGLKWHRKGNLSEAEKSFKKAITFSESDADLRVNLANVLLGQNKLQEATQQYEFANKLEPASARNRLLYGQALLKAKKLNEALEQFKIANELEPNYPFIGLNLGEALVLTGNHEPALGYLQKALAEDPNNFKIISLIATAQHSLGQLDAAIKNYQFLLTLEPSDEWPQINLARAYYQKNDLGAAEREYRSLVIAHPQRADLWSALADIQYRNGDIPKAIESIDKALSIDPNDASLHAMLAAYYDHSNDWKSSINHYHIAAELENNPETKSKYLMSEAQVLFKKGKYGQASVIIENILQQNPNNVTLKTQLADIRLWQKKYDEATNLYRETLVLKPDLLSNKGFVFNYGAALSGQKDWDDAEIVWQNYLKLDKSSKEAWLNLAAVQVAKKKPSDAINSYQSALLLGAAKVPTLNQIGTLQVQLNDLNGAEQTYRDLINLKPDTPKYRITLSRILAKEGKQEEAIRLLKQAGQSSSGVQLELAQRISNSGNYYSAATEYQKVLAEDSDNLEAIIGLADSYSAIGQFSEAAQLYKHYLKRQPESFHAQYNYALALANSGKENQAITEYKKTINMDSNYAESYYALGALLVDKDINAARENWKRYLDLQPQGEYKSQIIHHFPDLK